MKKLKKILCLIMVALLVIPSVTFAEAAVEIFIAKADNYQNVPFYNEELGEYFGFCLNPNKHEAEDGTSFTMASDTSAARSNVDNKDISQKLKVLFVCCFEDLFVSDGNGGYYLPGGSAMNANNVQAVVYHYTNNQYISGVPKSLYNKIEAYKGNPIPDYGETLTLDNGDVITFHFAVMQPIDSSLGMQDFFAYKIEVNADGAHEHDYEMKHDENGHWKECACNDVIDKADHKGGNATCAEKAICDVCQQPYGELDAENHAWDKGVYTEPTCVKDGYTTYTCVTDNDHKKVVENKSSATGEHKGGEATCTEKAICDVCEQPYGELDAEGHAWNKGAYTEPTCVKDGYTTYTCVTDNDHKKVVENKSSATGEHKGGEATCTEKAICDVCEQPYGELDENNHTEEIIPAVAPKCEKTGLTEGKKCSECGDVLKSQASIDALDHVFTEYTPNGNAKCQEDGTETSICDRCKTATDERIVPNSAIGHDWDEGVITAQPTYTEEGVRTYTCKNDASHTDESAVPVLEPENGDADGNGTIPEYQEGGKGEVVPEPENSDTEDKLPAYGEGSEVKVEKAPAKEAEIDKAVQTSDDFQMGLWTALAMLSLCACGALVLCGRKKEA